MYCSVSGFFRSALYLSDSSMRLRMAEFFATDFLYISLGSCMLSFLLGTDMEVLGHSTGICLASVA